MLACILNLRWLQSTREAAVGLLANAERLEHPVDVLEGEGAHVAHGLSQVALRQEGLVPLLRVRVQVGDADEQLRQQPVVLYVIRVECPQSLYYKVTMLDVLMVSRLKEYEQLEEGVGGEAFEVAVYEFVHLFDEEGVGDAEAGDLQEHGHDPHLRDGPLVTYYRIEQELTEALVEPVLHELEILPEEVYQQVKVERVRASSIIAARDLIADIVGEGGLIGVDDCLVGDFGQVDLRDVQVENLHIILLLYVPVEVRVGSVLSHLVVGGEQQEEELHVQHGERLVNYNQFLHRHQR